MRDGINDTPDNAVAQVAALEPGESYCRARFIPAFNVTPDKIRITKRRLLGALTPVIARARNRTGDEYRLHSFHNLTANCDVIVAAVVLREPEL